jgi:hypothetical protein
MIQNSPPVSPSFFFLRLFDTRDSTEAFVAGLLFDALLSQCMGRPVWNMRHNRLPEGVVDSLRAGYEGHCDTLRKGCPTPALFETALNRLRNAIS